MTFLKPIEKRSAEVRAADVLRESIIHGHLKPGERLTEMRLAEDLDVARATIRAALHQLVAEGLVDQVPYTGWSVMRLSAHDAWELYTLRASLEGLAARLACRNLAEAGAAELRKVFKSLERTCASSDRLKIVDADFSLHHTIISLAQHGRLDALYQQVRHQIRIYMAASDALLPDPTLIVNQHRPIVEKILERNEDEAARCSEMHNTEEGKALVNHLVREGAAGA